MSKYLKYYCRLLFHLLPFVGQVYLRIIWERRNAKRNKKKQPPKPINKKPNIFKRWRKKLAALTILLLLTACCQNTADSPVIKRGKVIYLSKCQIERTCPPDYRLLTDIYENNELLK